MMQLIDVLKSYHTGGMTVEALKGVNLTLRDNEFVAVLGQSGSGKTTLLNLVGGLDRYDAGDIIINDISTKKYTDRDWDSYRNHTIGFVFQNYNLISHQPVLSNVELALTISGISRTKRRKLAKEALEKVGLGDQIHKNPNQLSGGQMQRVAIARALVNDPDILLADEPTGALDSETSLQVMGLLKEVAKDRLVVMVTHNSELADKYATRIVKLHDGEIINDTNPYESGDEKHAVPEHKNMGKSSMSFTTSLSLSFSNLKTKKARTILTSFAGSIGIIGIALILALSSGVNIYINDMQRDTMVSYPITINARSFDLSSMIEAGRERRANNEINHELDAVYSNSTNLEMASKAASSIKENNLTAFKKYLDDQNSAIHNYIGENGVVYSYDIKFDAYTYDTDGELVNTNGSGFETENSGAASFRSQMMSGRGGIGITSNSGNFKELLRGTNGNLINNAVKDNYNLLYGNWPNGYNEVVFVLNSRNEISTSTLYELGLLPSKEYSDILEKINNGEEIEIKAHKWSYEDICNKVFYMVLACDYYVENDDKLFDLINKDSGENLENLIKDGVKLTVTGVIRPNDEASYTPVSSGVGYTSALTDYVINYTNKSDVVKAQESNTGKNVINGMSFEPRDTAQKINDTKVYLKNLGVSEKANLYKTMMSVPPSQGDSSGTGNYVSNMSESEQAAALDQYLQNPEDDVLISIYDAYISSGSYDDNMSAFGVVSIEAPSSISIYSDSFEGKEEVSACIEEYNKTVSEEDKITYTDIVGLLMSSVTTIVNVISYVLIAFVAVSLIVSSIMIGIITYISVLERTKEIGILRAVGASKRNISQVFNAETFIVGFLSGLIGVGISWLLLIPGNAVIHMVTDTDAVNAVLPFISAVILVTLSMILTLIAGLIPSRKAAKKDPVVALRTE